jgi:hypothetical protein
LRPRSLFTRSSCVLLAAALGSLLLFGTRLVTGAPVAKDKGKPAPKDPHQEAADEFEKALADLQGKPRADLDKAATEPGVVATAATILRSERAVRARRAAVQYLGTRDPRDWPEVEMALIGALRADRNESVRYAAALALGQGNCCTKRTAAALRITIEGGTEDGNAGETSERVRKAARIALELCLKKLKGK